MLQETPRTKHSRFFSLASEMIYHQKSKSYSTGLSVGYLFCYSLYATHSMHVIHHLLRASDANVSSYCTVVQHLNGGLPFVLPYFLAMKENPQVTHPATTSMEHLIVSLTGKSSMISILCYIIIALLGTWRQ